MSNETMKITVPVAILILIVSIIVSFTGWVTNKTLNEINGNITSLGEKIDKLSEVRYDHETRLQILEKELNRTNKLREQ